MPGIYSKIDEKELLIRLKADSKQSFEELYYRYSARIYGNLKKLLKSDELAEEFLQEVFVKVWDKRNNIDVEKSFRSYLFRISENMVFDFFRKAARDKKLQDHLISVATEYYSHIEESLCINEDMAILSKAIDQLPPKRRHIFMLCKIEGKSYEEVSKELGISVSTINDHIVKASRSVKEHFALTTTITTLFLIAALA